MLVGMLYEYTLKEIQQNINTGVEYEIALFYKLLPNIEQTKVLDVINTRHDSRKIHDIISKTSVNAIIKELNERGLSLENVSFETQNDEVGPSDIVMHVIDSNNNKSQIGISVKYANTCTLNVTGKRFISGKQIEKLQQKLPLYTEKYIKEMTNCYGNVEEWFRKRKPSLTTDEYIDLIRNAVIENWKNIKDKDILLSSMFHTDSPIEFWVVTYNDKGYTLKTIPQTIEKRRANDVEVQKYQTSYVAFYLDGRKIGHMQVKFNNGILEKCKKINADIECQGVKMAFGKPFSSWNFSVEK